MAAPSFRASHVIECDAPRVALCGLRGPLVIGATSPATASCRRCKPAARELGQAIGCHTVSFFIHAQAALEPCLCGEYRFPGEPCPDPNCVTR